MKIFSFQGIIMLVVYIAVLDRVATMIPALPYVSPYGEAGFDFKVSGIYAVIPIAVAALLVTVTPRIF